MLANQNIIHQNNKFRNRRIADTAILGDIIFVDQCLVDNSIYTPFKNKVLRTRTGRLTLRTPVGQFGNL